MKTSGIPLRALSLLAIVVMTTTLVCPVLADNTVTFSGEILPPSGIPVAAFSATPLSGEKPLRVSFTDESTGDITRWAWDFDNDGRIDSRRQNPTYTYRTAGTYTVSLTVSGPDGADTETKTDYITVNEPLRRPVALFTQDTYLGKAPLTVHFTDHSMYAPTQYYWQFGDGATSTEVNPTHTYTRSGVYIVRLHVSNAAGSDDALGLVIVLRGGWWW
jgi:PKD repeat protein